MACIFWLLHTICMLIPTTSRLLSTASRFLPTTSWLLPTVSWLLPIAHVTSHQAWKKFCIVDVVNPSDIERRGLLDKELGAQTEVIPAIRDQQELPILYSFLGAKVGTFLHVLRLRYDVNHITIHISHVNSH